MYHPSIQAALGAAALIAAGPALAVKVANRDSQSHELTIKCSTTTLGAVGASSTRDIGKGPCTVTVKTTGSSASGSGKDELVIVKGRFSRK